MAKTKTGQIQTAGDTSQDSHASRRQGSRSHDRPASECTVLEQPSHGARERGEQSEPRQGVGEHVSPRNCRRSSLTWALHARSLEFREDPGAAAIILYYYFKPVEIMTGTSVIGR